MKCIIILFLFCQLLTAQPFTTLFTSGVEEVACYRIPAIATAQNGDIIVAIDERIPSCADLKDNHDINIVIRRSSDHGDTWSDIERIIDLPKGRSASDPSFIVDQETGSIFLFYNVMDLINAPNIYLFHYIKSEDNGLSWTQPRDVTNDISKAETSLDFKFITSGRGIQSSDGKLLHTLVNLRTGVSIFGSVDHGDTWQQFGTDILPGDESKIVELEDGTWMVNSRVQDAGCRWVHTSADQGQHWTSKADSSLIDPACNASLLKYNDEILFFSNIDHQEKRSNLILRKSTDSGFSWQEIRSIYEGAAAYSTMTILDNGDIGLVFEKDDYAEIVFLRIPVD